MPRRTKSVIFIILSSDHLIRLYVTGILTPVFLREKRVWIPVSCLITLPTSFTVVVDTSSMFTISGIRRGDPFVTNPARIISPISSLLISTSGEDVIDTPVTQDFVTTRITVLYCRPTIVLPLSSLLPRVLKPSSCTNSSSRSPLS